MSNFAGGWPGRGLLLMRLVVGAVVLWHAGPRLLNEPPVHIIAVSTILILSALLLIVGLWTPIAGAVVAVVAIRRGPDDGRTSGWTPSRSHDRRRADDARTRPIVDRRQALRMAATHRSAGSRQSFERQRLILRARGHRLALPTAWVQPNARRTAADAAPPGYTTLAGTRSSTSVPAPASLQIATSPPASAARSRNPRSP